jgi:hypothetical protein
MANSNCNLNGSGLSCRVVRVGLIRSGYWVGLPYKNSSLFFRKLKKRFNLINVHYKAFLLTLPPTLPVPHLTHPTLLVFLFFFFNLKRVGREIFFILPSNASLSLSLSSPVGRPSSPALSLFFSGRLHQQVRQN